MHKFIFILLILAGSACAALVLNGVPLTPHAFNKNSIPKQVRDEIQYIRQQGKESPLRVFFSHQDFFYKEPINVAVSANQPGAAVYYTLDGSEPSTASNVYTGPIHLGQRERTACTVLRAIAVTGTGRSNIITQSYFIGKDVDERFNTYVFSISGEPDDFYGRGRGILVPGKIYDDYMKASKSPSPHLWSRPANYNQRGREWERPVFVEAFSPSGARVISQPAGVRVKGESSRGLRQKSLRLIARKSYAPKFGKFKYPFFAELPQANGYGARVDTFDNLVLSNGCSVYSDARLIDALVARLAKAAGYPFTLEARPAAVFFNGRYYGNAWLMTQYNEQYLKKLYDTADDAFEVMRGGEHKIFTHNAFMRGEFWQLHQYAKLDMNEDSVFRAFSASMDVSNLLYYMAIELYVANRDWPRSNVRIWRYTGQSKSDAAVQQALDGRWRYIMFDMQHAMDSTSYPAEDERAKAHFSYASIRFAQEEIPFLRALLKRQDCLREFVNYMCDLAFVHFAADKVEKTSAELLNELEREFSYAASQAEEARLPDPLGKLKEERERALVFSLERPRCIIEEIRKNFGYTELFSIELEGPGRINTVTSGQGRYFVESTVPVRPCLPKWHVFDHWVVNGQVRTEETLLITGQDAVDGKVSIRLVSHEEIPDFFLASPYDHGKLCGFSLINSTRDSRVTAGLYLSDNLYDLKKSRLAEFTVAAGGRLDFVGQSYQSTEAILKIQLGFNPRRGEVVYLSDERGKILDYLAVP